ncbi:hypothetical protein N8964_01955 [Pontimonas sp.]|nr:hypothetical protein [Pontimonas sp.]
MARVFLDPTFDWRSNGLWRGALESLEADQAEHEIVLSPVHSPKIYLAEQVNIGARQGSSIDTDYLTGTSLADLVSSQEFVKFKVVATALLRRENNYGILREVDTEVLLIGMLNHWLTSLRQVKPDLVLFAVTPHFVETFALYHAACFLGIQGLWFQPSSLSPMMLPRTSLAGRLKQNFLDGLDYGAVSSEAEMILNASLEHYGSLTTPTYISRQRLVARQNLSLRGRLRAVGVSIKWLRKARFSAKFFPKPPAQLPAVLDRIVQVVVPRALSRELVRSHAQSVNREALPEDLAVFALHYEPERTSTPEGGDDASQLEQLIRAKRLIAGDVELVVREHSSQLSPTLQGYKGRSPLFYRLVKNQLGLWLDSEMPLDEVLSRSKVVFTSTGNIAVEAALRGVPVVYFGNPWWEGMPGTYRSTEVAPGFLKSESFRGAEGATARSFLKKRVLEEMLPGGGAQNQSLS